MIIILLGNSGSGKTTQIKKIEKNFNIDRIVTATTRSKRPGEKDKVDYYFLTLAEFEELKASGDLLEYAEYAGNFYGTIKRELEKYMGDKNGIAAVEIQGIKNIKGVYKDRCLSIYLKISREVLVERLKIRGDGEEKIKDRLIHFADYEKYSDYIIDGEKSEEEVYGEIKDIFKSLDIEWWIMLKIEVWDRY